MLSCVVRLAVRLDSCVVAFSMSLERYDSLVRIVGARIYESATKMSDDGQDNWNG